MKRTLLVLIGIALFSSPAAADKKTTWRNVAIGSGVFTIVSGAFTFYKIGEVDAIKTTLCDGGAIFSGCKNDGRTTLTPMDLDELNARGSDAANKANIGMAGTALGVGVTAFAVYKFVTSEEDKPEPAVIVAPVVTREGGGASVQMRF